MDPRKSLDGPFSKPKRSCGIYSAIFHSKKSVRVDCARLKHDQSTVWCFSAQHDDLLNGSTFSQIAAPEPDRFREILRPAISKLLRKDIIMR